MIKETSEIESSLEHHVSSSEIKSSSKELLEIKESFIFYKTTLLFNYAPRSFEKDATFKMKPLLIFVTPHSPSKDLTICSSASSGPRPSSLLLLEPRNKKENSFRLRKKIIGARKAFNL